MANSYFQLLSQCADEQLKRICELRRLPVPIVRGDSDEGRHRLLKTMVFHLESNKQIIDVIAGLPSNLLKALKALSEKKVTPDDALVQTLFDLGLALPEADSWTVPERVGNALEDFDDGALSFQAETHIELYRTVPYSFSLALTSVLLRCVNGVRVLKGGIPAKKELTELVNQNAFLADERDVTLVFALLHRMGILWSREGCVDTLVASVIANPPRWVAERAFARLLEDDLKFWKMPSPDDRRFLMRHLLERKGQILKINSFLCFLQTLQPLDEHRLKAVFLPFLLRMGLVATDATQDHFTLTDHGIALAQEYLLRDSIGTEGHWAPMNEVAPIVTQQTLELLTPALQNPHHLLRLAQLADIETIDTMVSYRFGVNTLVRALDSGISIEDARTYLKCSDDSDISQPLNNLLSDIEQRLGEVEVEQGVRLVRTRTGTMANELCIRPELMSLALEPISDTVMQVKGTGNAYAMLKQAGFIPKPVRFLPVSIDDNENLYVWALACLALVDEKGMNTYLDPSRQMIHDALQRIQADDPSLFHEIKRRVLMLNPEGGGEQDIEKTKHILEYAAEQNFTAEIAYVPLTAQRAQPRRITPRAIDGEYLHAYCHLHQEEMTFRLTRIIGVRILNEKGYVASSSEISGPWPIVSS